VFEEFDEEVGGGEPGAGLCKENGVIETREGGDGIGGAQDVGEDGGGGAASMMRMGAASGSRRVRCGGASVGKA
jgi:hypothetical protein